MCVNHNKQSLPVFFKVRTIYGKTTLVYICSSEILHTGIKVRLHIDGKYRSICGSARNGWKDSLKLVLSPVSKPRHINSIFTVNM